MEHICYNLFYEIITLIVCRSSDLLYIKSYKYIGMIINTSKGNTFGMTPILYLISNILFYYHQSPRLHDVVKWLHYNFVNYNMKTIDWMYSLLNSERLTNGDCMLMKIFTENRTNAMDSEWCCRGSSCGSLLETLSRQFTPHETFVLDFHQILPGMTRIAAGMIAFCSNSNPPESIALKLNHPRGGTDHFSSEVA